MRKDKKVVIKDRITFRLDDGARAALERVVEFHDSVSAAICSLIREGELGHYEQLGKRLDRRRRPGDSPDK